MVPVMSKSNLVAFRVPAECQDAFNESVAASCGDKTAWLIDVMRNKLNLPESNSQSCMMALVDRMEIAVTALAGGKQGIPPTTYNEEAVIGIVANTIRKGLDNGRIIAERLNESGYQTKAGKAWDKDIYSAWKLQGHNAEKLEAVININH